MNNFSNKINYFNRTRTVLLCFILFSLGIYSKLNAQQKNENNSNNAKEQVAPFPTKEWEDLEEAREKEQLEEYKKQMKAAGLPYKVKGILAPSNFVKKDWKQFHKMNSRLVNAAVPSTSPWQQIPFIIDHTAGRYGAKGVGVVRCIAIQPGNTSRVIAGSSLAGLWLTTDKGTTWQLVGKDTPLVESIFGIKFAPGNSNLVYAITNVGLIKSTDAGVTWNYTTNFLSNLPYTASVTMLEVSSKDSNKVFVCAKAAGDINGGIYRTTNGGSSWTTLKSGKAYWDIKLHPINDAIIYAIEQTPAPSLWSKFVRSTDGGTTFTEVNNGYPSSPIAGRQLLRGVIAVSSAATDYVYVFSAGNKEYGFWRSTDAGVSFSKRDKGWAGDTNLSVVPLGSENTNDGKLTVGYQQVDWDFAMTVSSTNPELVYAGAFRTMYSANGGNTWSHFGNPKQEIPYIHPDIQGLDATGNEAWMVNDGGAYYSDNGGKTVTDKSEGIYASECWGFSHAFKSDIMAAGMNHNAIFIRDPSLYNQWLTAPGADAKTATVNPLDDRYIYAQPWWETRFTRNTARNTPLPIIDLGVYSGYVNYQNFVIHPNLYYKIYVVGHSHAAKPELAKGVAVSNDNALSWSTVKSFPDIESKGGRMQISFANPKTMFATIKSKRLPYQLWKTNDESNWTDTTPSASLTTGFIIKNIALSDKDRNRAWLLLGSSSAVKVLQTTDGGASWTNYSDGLPLTQGSFGMVYQRWSLHRNSYGSLLP
jgi:photosystem II stability/assembly factor-like uncharacterized protein